MPRTLTSYDMYPPPMPRTLTFAMPRTLTFENLWRSRVWTREGRSSPGRP